MGREVDCQRLKDIKQKNVTKIQLNFQVFYGKRWKSFAFTFIIEEKMILVRDIKIQDLNSL